MKNYDESNARKTPLGLSLNQFASRKIADAIAQLGGELPCRVVAVAGQIVTVSFELNAAPFTLPQVSMPIATWIYDWIPVQIGDHGMTVASDVYLGGISGIGGGVADRSRPGNLTSLLFVPVANSAWMPPATDPLVRVVQGPDGVMIRDLANNASIFLWGPNNQKQPVGTITVTSEKAAVQVRSGDGATTITLSAKDGTITMVAPNGITLNGVKIDDDGFTKIPQDLSVGTGGSAVTSYLNHTHGGVQSGGSSTSAPNPGT